MDSLFLLSSLFAGLFAMVLSGTTLYAITSARPRAIDSFEEARRSRLRQADATYRWLEPIVNEVAALHRALGGNGLAKIQWRLNFLPDRPPYLPEEFLAVKNIEGVLLGFALLPIAFFIGTVPAVIAAVLVAWGYGQLAVMNLRDHCKRRMLQLTSRLPFTMDMMALMMTAGGSFQESLEAAVRENGEHALGQELGVVNRELTLGRSRKDALRELERRVDDESFRELVFAVVKGEELGTPLSQIFTSQAEQLRLRRSQWAEKASGEAQVKIVYPGMLIMLACLLITVAPFLLRISEIF